MYVSDMLFIPLAFRPFTFFLSSRYKVAITKHKDNEQTSSSLYSQNYMWSPFVDFSKYIEDDEAIVNEVLMYCFYFSRYLYLMQIMT